MATVSAGAALVLDLRDAPADAALVGGKAAHLASMLRAGLAVPSGFCLTTAAFQAMVAGGGLGERIQRALDGADSQDPAALARAAETIRAAFTEAPLAAELREALRAAYRGLGPLPHGVAVRSSATTEDSAEATFAGQHETILHVLDEAALERAVRACWASLYSPQALGYRARRGEAGDAALAVVVQRMVDARVAGVAFSANPLTGATDEVHVSAVYGLGETLASGRATPDLVVLRGPDLAVAYTEIGEKAVAARLAAGGGIREEAVTPERRAAPALDAALAVEVGRATRELAGVFGSPQDVEWAWDGETLLLLQSRPMRFAPRAATAWPSPVPGARWYRNWRLGEWLAEPLTPLFETALLPILAEGRESHTRHRLGWGMPQVFSMLRPWYCVVNGYYYTRDDRDEASRAVGSGPEVRVKLAERQTEILNEWKRTHRRAYRRRLERLRRQDPRAKSGAALLATLDELYTDAAEWWFLISNIGYGGERRSLKAAYDSVYEDPRKPDLLTLCSGFDSRTLRAQRELYAMAQAIGADPALRALVVKGEPAAVLAELPKSAAGAAVLERLEAYRAEHGHQVFTLDYGEPTLGEQSAALVASLQRYLGEDAPPPGKELGRLGRRRQAAARRLRSLTPTRPERLAELQVHLGFQQTASALREDVIYEFQRIWPVMRSLLLELGRRLVEAGALEQVEDVFYLQQAELAAAMDELDAGRPVDADFHGRVAERRAARDAQRRLAPPERIDDASGSTSVRAAMHTGSIVEDERGRRLLGQPASPGVARGPARVIRSTEDFGKLRKGDVLVCTVASPAWTVLFPLAVGLVTEVGGAATHSSLVAREYGLPAVVATGIATQVVRDGQVIAVDGDNGEVLLAPPGGGAMAEGR